MESDGHDQSRVAKRSKDATSLQNGGQLRTPRNKAVMTRPSKTLSHWHYRPSWTSSGAHLSIRCDTLITLQLLPVGTGTARINLSSGVCKEGQEEDDSPG